MRQCLLTSTAILCFIAGSAAAQDLCGGAGAGGQWIGGTEAGSDIATTDSHLEQMALVLGGNNHVALFTLSDRANVRIEAQGRGTGDPIIDLFDESGAVLLSDDDSGGNGAARLETELTEGTYCVSTNSFDGAPMTAFVRIGRTDQDALTSGLAVTAADPGDFVSGSCAEAVDLGTLDGQLTHEDTASGAPFLNFSIDTPRALSIFASNENADPVLRVFDANETLIAENDDFVGLNSRVDFVDPLAPGTYCIGLEALADGDDPIFLEITEYDPVATLRALIDRGEAAPDMDGSHPITNIGSIETRKRHDTQASENAVWISFEMPEAGVIIIEAISPGSTGDTWLALYDDLGRQITENDDYGASYDSLLAARLTRGTYLVALKDVGAATGPARLLFERFVPVP